MQTAGVSSSLEWNQLRFILSVYHDERQERALRSLDAHNQEL
jgi:hypothetical protein